MNSLPVRVLKTPGLQTHAAEGVFLGKRVEARVQSLFGIWRKISWDNLQLNRRNLGCDRSDCGVSEIAGPAAGTGDLTEFIFCLPQDTEADQLSHLLLRVYPPVPTAATRPLLTIWPLGGRARGVGALPRACARRPCSAGCDALRRVRRCTSRAPFCGCIRLYPLCAFVCGSAETPRCGTECRATSSRD